MRRPPGTVPTHRPTPAGRATASGAPQLARVEDHRVEPLRLLAQAVRVRIGEDVHAVQTLDGAEPCRARSAGRRVWCGDLRRRACAPRWPAAKRGGVGRRPLGGRALGQRGGTSAACSTRCAALAAACSMRPACDFVAAHLAALRPSASRSAVEPDLVVAQARVVRAASRARCGSCRCSTSRWRPWPASAPGRAAPSRHGSARLPAPARWRPWPAAPAQVGVR